uniref:exodeoxyribonuclease III n=1 Tax=Pseudonaja textilis TaxID=8673 RepID=A0A670XY46_PSETE
MNNYQILSVTINGLNSPAKRNQILKKLAKQKMDTVCLQEVHVRAQDKRHLICPKLGKLFTAPANKHKKKGIAIYVKQDYWLQHKQIYKDQEERMFFIEINVNQKKMLLVTIYAPNTNQKDFYNRLHHKIIEFEYANVCIVGDYNAVPDKDKDYRTSKKKKKKKERRILPSSFNNIVRELNLKDVCRELNPNKKQYTFFSNPHHSWSRIDQIWMDPGLMENIERIEILPNLWADQNPIQIKWKGKRKIGRWTFNNTILRDKEYIEMIKKERIGSHNTYGIKKNKEKRQQQNIWREKLKDLEISRQKDPNNSNIKKEIDLVKHKINLNVQEDLAQKIKLAKQNYFENANKPGTWLAHKIKKEQEKRMVIALPDQEEKLCTQTQEKKKIAKEFFMKLYKQEEKPEESIDQYLNEKNLPKITDEEK